MLLVLLEDELNKLGEALMERSEASPCGFESVREWHCSVQAYLRSE